MAGTTDPRFCECCEPASPRAPVEIMNRPGLPALAYRIGTFAGVRAAILDEIVREPALSGLATRESDDYAITLVELFAAVGDVLTFYSERIANELYLSTARERESIQRLVRLIGYRLRPGLAAEALLAFTLDAGASTRIRRGLKVMSIPGQDERPQTFETLEEIQADARLNALPAYAPPVVWNPYNQGRDAAPLVARPDPLGPGDRILIFAHAIIEEKEVKALRRARDGERLAFAPPVQAPWLWPAIARAVKLERRLRFFGHNAPDSYPSYNPDPAIPPAKRWTTIHAGDTGYAMDFAADATSYPLDTRYESLKPGARLLVDAGPTADPRLRTAVVEATEEQPATLGPLQDTVTYATLTQTTRGRPAIAAPTGSVHGISRSGMGRVLALTSASPRWQVLGNVVASEDPSALVVQGNTVRLFVRDHQAHLRGNTWAGGAWAGWVDLGGILTTRPSAVEAAGGEVLIFARGLDSGLWVIRQTPAGLIGWAPLHGVLTTPPAPVSWGGSRVDVFVRGLDRGLWRIARDGLAWGAWESLGGTLATTPAAASTAPQRLDVVALDDAGALLHRRWTGSAWTDWLNLGGRAKGEPAIAATGPDRVDVFVRGTDDQVWRIARNGATWEAWQALGGPVASAPSVARAGGQLHLAAQDAQGALIVRTWTGTGWTPWTRLGGGLGAIPNRRATRIFEFANNDIIFREYEYPPLIQGGRVAARLADAPGLGKLDAGRRILLDDGATRHSATVTRTESSATDAGAPADHLLIDFDPPLPVPLGTATLVGNVARASHGETQPDEPLGHGDATRAFPRYRLRRAPLTYLATTTNLAGEPELEVRVNGERWRRVGSLYNQRPTDRVYTARQTDAGDTEITFGDGTTGATVPTGALNIVARYRTGLGLVGRMRADQLAIPLERPVGLRAVTNPLQADGGADPESRDDARRAAPTTVRTFGRAVSLEDFAWLATSSGLVARAEATWVWHRSERVVHLTVAGAGGAPFSVESLRTLYEGLTAARDPNRVLLLGNLVRVPLVVRARIVGDPAFEDATVLAAARAALLARFAFEAMPLARSVHASDVIAVLQGARGVVGVDLDEFHLKGHADLTAAERAVRAVTTAPMQPHVRIFAARPTPADPSAIDRFARAGFKGPPPPVLAAEQAYLEDPAADVALTLVEAL
jgi:hypothetical protein